MQKAIFDVFKMRYGTENDAYWNKLVNRIIPVNEGVSKNKNWVPKSGYAGHEPQWIVRHGRLNFLLFDWYPSAEIPINLADP